jgi:quinol monooxygenase YgiN
MAVVVIARMKLDPASLEEAFTANRSVFEAVSADAKKAGATRHQFVAGDGEVVIIDEWPDAQSFQQFFADPRIAELMQQTGVAGPPDISIYTAMDSPDRF